MGTDMVRDEPSEDQKKQGRFLLAIAVPMAVLLTAFTVWLYWPYSEVTYQGPSVLSNEPESIAYRTGDVIRWTTKEVCQPDGQVLAKIYAKATFPTDSGDVEVRTFLVERNFYVPEYALDTCIKDNPTSVFVNGNLSSGTYSFEVEACAYNSSPKPKCVTVPGPSNVIIKRVAGNEPEKE